MKLLKALNPLGSICCELLTFVLTLKSKWFRSLSHQEAHGCTITMRLYFVFTFFVAVFAYAKEWPQRRGVNLMTKFVIQAVVSGIIIFLTDKFGEHHTDYFLAGAFVFVALHFHLGAHSFHVLEDYGVAQGLITVAITAIMHIPMKLSWKIVATVVGGLVSAIYCFVLNREEKIKRNKLLRDMDEVASDMRRGYEEELHLRDASALDMRNGYEAQLYERNQIILQLEARISALNAWVDQGESSAHEE